MSVTVTIRKRLSRGNGRATVADFTGDASYDVGGEVLTDAQLNDLMPEHGGKLAVATPAHVALIEVFQSEKDITGRELALNRANGKILFFAAGAEVAGAVNLSAVTVRAVIEYQLEPTTVPAPTV